MDSEERQPLEMVLPGLGVFALDDGWTAQQAFVLIKCLDEDGDPVWCFRTTEQLNRNELLGALEVQVALLKRELVRLWDEDD
jgi:hypothetical protein